MRGMYILDHSHACDMQNLTILLSRMKLNYEEIKLLLLQMDEDEELPRDMLEQVRISKVVQVFKLEKPEGLLLLYS